MTIQERAAALNIPVEVLFERAFKISGNYLSPSGSATKDFEWFARWGTTPLYVLRYLKNLEASRKLPVKT